MKKTILLYVAFLLLLAAVFTIGSVCAYAAVNIDIGLPMYPGATVNPAYPPINESHTKNIHILILPQKCRHPHATFFSQLFS